MNYECELIEAAAQPIISIRTRTAVANLPQVLGSAYGSMGQYLGEMGEQPTGAPFVAYYNMDMQDLDIEVGFPVAKELPGKNDIKPGFIPAGKQAICIHKGPYDQVGSAYGVLTEYVKQLGLTPTGVAYEYYLNEPGVTPENELLTRIVFTVF